ncbi:non-specific serine,threonine protein kinase [Sarracenia purpurea var. burkii]
MSRLLDSIAFSGWFMGFLVSEHPIDVQDSFIIVKFDTSFDLSLDDINDNHAIVNVNSVVSLTSVDAFSRGINLKSGKQMAGWRLGFVAGGTAALVWGDDTNIFGGAR